MGCRMGRIRSRYSWHFEVKGAAEQESGSSQQVRLELRRNDGVLRTSYSGEKNIVISGPESSSEGVSATLTNVNGEEIEVGDVTVVNFSSGLGYGELRL